MDYKKEFRTKSSLLILIITFILSACNINTNIGPAISTWTPSPSATPTCIPDIGLSTPEGWGRSRIIVILYDDRPIADGLYLQLENGKTTENPSVFIKSILPKLIKPGDQISIFQLGYSSFDDAIVSRVFSYTSLPELFNTPPPPIIIPSNSPVTLTPGFGYVATQNALTQEAKAIIATNSANESDYRCAVDYWNSVVQQTATTWDTIATAEISDITNKMNKEFEIYNSEEGKGNREKPYRTNELYYGGIYYGLSFATSVFGKQCQNEIECILLIIDDLNVYEENNPDNLDIDLKGVKTITAMYNCRYIDQPECAPTQEYWNDEFSKFGVLETNYWDGSRAESNILDYIGRQ
jgi:hypothetical protein